MASAVVSDNFETSSGAVPELGGTGATTCKAWVSFDGSSTVAINDSYNVSSITDQGTGDFRVNFTNTMPNNYTVSTGGNQISNHATRSDSIGKTVCVHSRTTARVDVICGFFSSSVNIRDFDHVSLCMFAS